MSQQSLPKKFVFHEQVDKAFIFSLYENDYAYIVEVYRSSLEALAEDVPEVQAAIAAGDGSRLKKAVHKIKPVFGFTGLLNHQQKLAQFETDCEQPAASTLNEKAFAELTATLNGGREIMEHELAKLTAFLQ